MGESIITGLEFTEKISVSGAMSGQKKWPIVFSLSVMKGNVLSARGRIDGFFLLLIKAKVQRKSTANGQQKIYLC